jgi:hyperosmotically inducible protein
MIRFLFRLVLLVVLVAVAGVLLLGWAPGSAWVHEHVLGRGPAAEVPVVSDDLKEATAKAGARAADLAAQAQAALSEGSITAKIKAKMALDDTIDARDVHIAFEKGVVTLTGRVSTQPERTRVRALARETAGVSSVVDRLSVGRP